MAAIIFLFEYWAKEEFETKMKRRAESRIDQFQVKNFQKRPGEKEKMKNMSKSIKLGINFLKTTEENLKTHLITKKNVNVLESVP